MRFLNKKESYNQSISSSASASSYYSFQSKKISKEDAQMLSMYYVDSSITPPEYSSITPQQTHHKTPIYNRPEEDNQTEILPSYSPSIYKEGIVSRKYELVSPFMPSSQRSWSQVYMQLNSTQLVVYSISKRKDTTTTSAAYNNNNNSATPLLNFQLSMKSSSSSSLSSNFTPPLSSITAACCGLPISATLQINKPIACYTLQYATVGAAFDYSKRPFVLRVRAQGQQFLIELGNLFDCLSWANCIQLGIDIALPLEERVLPRLRVFPRTRRNRRRNRRVNRNDTTTTSTNSSTSTVQERRHVVALTRGSRNQIRRLQEWIDSDQDSSITNTTQSSTNNNNTTTTTTTRIRGFGKLLSITNSLLKNNNNNDKQSTQTQIKANDAASITLNSVTNNGRDNVIIHTASSSSSSSSSVAVSTFSNEINNDDQNSIQNEEEEEEEYDYEDSIREEEDDEYSGLSQVINDLYNEGIQHNDDDNNSNNNVSDEVDEMNHDNTLEVTPSEVINDYYNNLHEDNVNNDDVLSSLTTTSSVSINSMNSNALSDALTSATSNSSTSFCSPTSEQQAQQEQKERWCPSYHSSPQKLMFKSLPPLPFGASWTSKPVIINRDCTVTSIGPDSKNASIIGGLCEKYLVRKNCLKRVEVFRAQLVDKM